VQAKFIPDQNISPILKNFSWLFIHLLALHSVNESTFPKKCDIIATVRNTLPIPGGARVSYANFQN
jgi:hypothetical protein